MNKLRINRERLIEDFEALAEIGSTGDGGVHRPALSSAHLDAREWLKRRIAASGMEVSVDAAGNVSGLLPASLSDATTLLIGSHLDSVPFGGRFDGALGVLVGLEVLRTIKESGLHMDVNLEVIDFTDEEGTLIGLLGSRALVGSLPKADLASPRGGVKALSEGFGRAGIIDPIAAKRDIEKLAGYLEVHIEQGARLKAAGNDIGIVSGFVGIVSYEIEIVGRADHAGTTLMDQRLDAGYAAAEFMVAARKLVMDSYPESVVNFGQCRFSPGAYNIVPDKAVLGLEFRSPDQAELDLLDENLIELLKEISKVNGVSFRAIRQGCLPPAPCSPEVKAYFAAATERLGLKYENMFSGAGHDAQALAFACPSGLIFIPSSGGSHNPKEYASWEDCENGANVILHTVLLGWGPQG